MKQHILILIVLTTLFSACHPDRCCNIKIPGISVYAIKNGKAWAGFSSQPAIMGDTVNIFAFGNDNTYGLEENLGLSFKATGKGTYALQGVHNFYYNTVGRDVQVSEYKLDSLYANKVTVTDYDKSNNIVNGTFEARFIKIYENPTNAYPDTLHFLNGRFKARMHE